MTTEQIIALYIKARDVCLSKGRYQGAAFFNKRIESLTERLKADYAHLN